MPELHNSGQHLKCYNPGKEFVDLTNFNSISPPPRVTMLELRSHTLQIDARSSVKGRLLC